MHLVWYKQYLCFRTPHRIFLNLMTHDGDSGHVDLHLLNITEGDRNVYPPTDGNGSVAAAICSDFRQGSRCTRQLSADCVAKTLDCNNDEASEGMASMAFAILGAATPCRIAQMTIRRHGAYQKDFVSTFRINAVDGIPRGPTSWN